MTDTMLPDTPQTMARLDSVSCLLDWMRGMETTVRRQFVGALMECSDSIQHAVVSMMAIAKDQRAAPQDRQRALTTLADALFLRPDETDREYGQPLAESEAYTAKINPALNREVRSMNSQQEFFAQRLRAILDSKRISQLELARRMGCTQPAISQLLDRLPHCRPQKRTIHKLAEALAVPPQELWPDLDTAEMLDAVARFQQDDCAMTEAEAAALRAPSKSKARLKPKPLPPRPRP